MSNILRVLLRATVLGLAITAFYAALPYLFPDDGGAANIGAGLLAFAGIALASLVWALLDARRLGLSSTLWTWPLVAVLVSLGWLVALSIAQADETMTTLELIRADAGMVPFTFGILFLPAVLGAALGGATHGEPHGS